jgi:hypothetical protein
LFRPAHLGDKWAVADYAIELVNSTGKFFLVQVKSTQVGCTRDGRLRVAVSADRYARLSGSWLPSHIVGVDDPLEEAYICATSPRAGGLGSLTTRHSLRDPEVRQQLNDEVDAFWTTCARSTRPWTSRLC